jgi:fermentation-respiration switch protein FrsA (DUF1100 family)
VSERGPSFEFPDLSGAPGGAPRAPGRRSLGSRSWRIALALILGGLVLGWLMARFETRQLYFPTPWRGDDPGRWGLPFEEVMLTSEDGETLRAWWIPQRREEAPALLFLHGNAGNREDRLHHLQGLWRAGLSVLIVDYRGYGGSSGTPSEQGLIRDGLAGYDWLAGRRAGRPIVLFGESLGGAVAAQVALRRPAAGLILLSTFTSVPDLAERLFPVPGLRRIVRTRFDTLAALRQLRMPLLIVHGRRDEIVPFDMGETLFREAASAEKFFRPVPDGHHNDTYFLAGGEYWRWVGEFASRVRSN